MILTRQILALLLGYQGLNNFLTLRIVGHSDTI